LLSVISKKRGTICQMADANKRLVVRARALAKLEELFRAPGICCAIHYSCESFRDNPEGSSRRVTSIAIKNLETGTADSFSIHQFAEIKGVVAKDIETQYDALEKSMLDAFYETMQQKQGFKWLHWNMRDSNYGFPAIAHRYKVLKGTPVEIQPERQIDLSALLQDIYGPNYIGHQRLEQLAKYNEMTMLGFLTGKEEAQAFVDKQYVLLHQSTLRKVSLIATIAERQWQGGLKTQAKPIDVYGSRLRAVVDSVTNSPWFKIGGFVGLLLSVGRFIAWLIGQVLTTPSGAV